MPLLSTGAMGNYSRTDTNVVIEPPPEIKESWLGAFKYKGKIIGDIVSPASNETEWGILSDRLFCLSSSPDGQKELLSLYPL